LNDPVYSENKQEGLGKLANKAAAKLTVIMFV
jgi:hypothetical protein